MSAVEATGRTSPTEPFAVDDHFPREGDDDHGRQGRTGVAGAPRRFKQALRRVSAAVVCVCLALSVALAWAAHVVDARSNHRLLVREVEQAGATLSSALPVVQSQLVDAVQVAVDTNANPQVFQRFVAASPSSTGSTAAISLWQLRNGTAKQIALQGKPLALVSDHLDAAFFARVHPSAQLFVTGIIPGTPTRLGYAEMPLGDTSGLVVYREAALPTQHITIPAASPFAGLRVALYLGPRPVNQQLLEATDATPIPGRTASTSLPFGDTVITVVGASKSPLAGGLSGALPWIVLGVGAVVALVSGSVVEFSIRRRLIAEGLAKDNERLYRQQRTIAGTLQHALLPQMPVIAGVEIGARYSAGVADLEVGGDWYDVITTDQGRVVFFVGDVSGRGLHAATTMASLRYAVRAYTAQGDDIQTVLIKLGLLLDFESDRQFATVLAGEIDLAAHRVTVASAGHFMPLLLSGGSGLSGGNATYVVGPVAPPIGVSQLTNVPTVTFDVPRGATLLAFTDGLIERRDDASIDTGLDRLRRAAIAHRGGLEDLMDALMSELVGDNASDDTVLLGVRWQI
jgi:serine phosphatase RsbU (regulator of sigma subunit)